MIHYQDDLVTLHHADCRTVLAGMADASVDAIVTDPPYELGFMGRTWDSSGIAYDVAMWTECLRVLKPGGHLLSFGASRTFHRMAVAVEDAGFEIRDSIAWLYGSGFPKSMNVAKAIESGGGRPEDIRRMQMGEDYSPSGRGRVNYDHGGGSAMGGKVEKFEPATDAAKAWEGWGTALKPAFEPIVVGRKPMAGTVAANVLAHGTGAINIDGTRTHGTGSEAKAYNVKRLKPGATLNREGGNWRPENAEAPRFQGETKAGRWPTNVLLDGSQADALDKQTGILTSGANPATRNSDKFGNAYGEFKGKTDLEPARGADSGGASRFFPTFRYEAKAPGSERPEVDGVQHATVKPLGLMRWLVRLVTPPGGVVFEPFAGSGTTIEAALLEGFTVIAAELEAAHLPLIEQRINKPLQQSLFGDF